MKVFTYSGLTGFGAILLQVGGAVAIVFTTVVGIVMMVAAVLVNPPYWDAGCFVIWIFIMGWVVGLSLMNSLPTIWVTDQGIILTAFIVKRISIPWSDIVEVGAGRVPFGYILVTAKRITPFHRIYGWLYSRTLSPGFLIGRNIEGYDELLRELRRHGARYYRQE